jgi:hypothetical protein
MAARPRKAPRGRPDDACLDGKRTKKQPSNKKNEDSLERKKKEEVARKKKRARWNRNYRKRHKLEIADSQRAYRARKRKDPKFVKKEREANRKRRYATYGITIDDYDVMFARQRGLCLICKGKRKRKKPNPKKKCKDGRRHNGKQLCVDHCHKLKMVRGLLCGRCNSMIGYGDDDPWILSEGSKYLLAFLKRCAAEKQKKKR